MDIAGQDTMGFIVRLQFVEQRDRAREVARIRAADRIAGVLSAMNIVEGTNSMRLILLFEIIGQGDDGVGVAIGRTGLNGEASLGFKDHRSVRGLDFFVGGDDDVLGIRLVEREKEIHFRRRRRRHPVADMLQVGDDVLPLSRGDQKCLVDLTVLIIVQGLADIGDCLDDDDPDVGELVIGPVRKNTGKT